MGNVQHGHYVSSSCDSSWFDTGHIKKLKGCIWERCKGVTSWIKFGDSSLWHLHLGLEDCENITRNQDWCTKWEEDGRHYKLERRSNNGIFHLMHS